jgi:hypothetical protein
MLDPQDQSGAMMHSAYNYSSVRGIVVLPHQHFTSQIRVVCMDQYIVLLCYGGVLLSSWLFSALFLYFLFVLVTVPDKSDKRYDELASCLHLSS